MFYLHCKFCRDVYEHSICDAYDIIDTKSGRQYLFDCPYCGQPVKSCLIGEQDEVSINSVVVGNRSTS